MKRAKGASLILNARALVPKGPVAAVRAVWILVILWYEVGTYHWSLGGCRWPDAELAPDGKTASSSSTSRQEPPIHVLLIADPQVHAPRKHPVWRRWLHLTDLSLRKRWSFVRRVQPDVAIFLGDMLENGRYAGDDEYRESFESFKSVFHVEPNTTEYYVPGNHDVGLGPSGRIGTVHARGRYLKHFGPLNNRISIANHTIVMLDAPGLVDEDYRRAATGKSFEDWRALPDGTIEFINNFAGVGSEDPIVLFSHIPLFRPDTAGCGPLREKGTIRRGVGPGFQNILMRDTTNYILRYVRPAAVFSGNDHDYCEYTHSIPLLSEGPEPKIDHVREVTVKAISDVGDIRRPGFQLLSLAPAPVSHQSNSQSFADVPCFFPDEQNIHHWRYIPLLILSLLVLFVSAARRHHIREQHRGSPRPRLREEEDLDRDTNEVLPLSASPHDGPSQQNLVPTSLFSTAHISGSSSLAPTLRATGQHTPLTPDFAVEGEPPSGFHSSGPSSGSPTRVTLHHARFRSINEPVDVEGDEEDFEMPEQFARYQLMSDKSDDYFRLTLDRARRRRRLAWTWTFELGGRRRRLVVGVPFLLEHVCRTFWAAVRGIVTDWRRSNAVHETVVESFLRTVFAAAWPSFLLICVIHYFLL